MKERVLTIPELILIAGTCVALGVGIGLLLADKLTDNQRLAAGWALNGVGALTTVPLFANEHALCHRRRSAIGPEARAARK